MPNDIQIKGGHPISENLSTVTVGDQTTCLEISDNNGARVTGDLEVTGALSVSSLTDLIIDDLILDDITCGDIVCNTIDADGGVTVDNITIDGTEIDSSSSLTLDVATDFTVDAEDDIILDCGSGDEITFKENDNTFMKFDSTSNSLMTMYEGAGGTDSFAIQTITNGATYMVTTDADGNEADLSIVPDGFLTLNSHGYSPTIAEASSEALTLSPGTKVHIDKNRSHVTAAVMTALHVDLDRTGAVASGTDISTGIDLDVNHTGASGGTITTYGLDIDVIGDATIASNKAIGASINASGANIATGLEIDVDGGTTSKTVGLYIECEDGGVDFKNVSSAEPLDHFTIKTIEDGETTLTTFENGGGSTAHLNLDADGDITLNSASGNFIAEKAGTEFSVANSAYAGMILGYTRIMNDGSGATDNIITINSSAMTVIQTTDGTDLSIQFIVPPSGNVEIQCSFWVNALSDGAKFSLSTASSYSELGITHTYDADQNFFIDETDHNIFNISFAVTGLTAGTDTTYYLAGLASSTSAYINHGRFRLTGNHYPPIILKAIALPATIVTGE